MKTASRRGVTRTGKTRWAVMGVRGLGRQTERIDRVLDVAQAHITWWQATGKQQLCCSRPRSAWAITAVVRGDRFSEGFLKARRELVLTLRRTSSDGVKRIDEERVIWRTMAVR